MKTRMGVAVQTVGLTPHQQAELAAQLARWPAIDLEHFGGCSFRLLDADIIVLCTDTTIEQEALDMLRNYASVKRPRLVAFSERDERLRSLNRLEREPGFPWRLQQALRHAGCPGVVIDAPGSGVASHPPALVRGEHPVAHGRTRESG